MARIIENTTGGRRIIKLSTSDIISVIQEYQQHVGENRRCEDVRSILDDNVIFIPEDV